LIAIPFFNYQLYSIKMAKAAIFGGLAAILVVAAVVATIATVSQSHKSSAPPLATSTKSVSAFCANTLYPETCHRSLSTVVNASSNPKDVVKASVELALNELKESFHKSLDVGKGSDNSITKGAIANCKELLQDASDDLMAIVKLGNDALNRKDDLEHWITAVMTFMDNCADGFEDSELKTAMQNVLRNATEMSSNALAIITYVGDFLKEADKLFNVTNFQNAAGFQHRRLLGANYALDTQGYPTWLSPGDRKLLAAGGAPRAKPNAVVAKDGSGNFKSIQAAINAVPKDFRGRYVIYVKAGVYDEIVLIPKDKTNIYMYGDGPKRSRVTGHKSNADGLTTQDTATFCKLLLSISLRLYMKTTTYIQTLIISILVQNVKY
jgi:pectinesterase